MKIPEILVKNKKITVLIVIGLVSIILLTVSEFISKSDVKEKEENTEVCNYSEEVETKLTKLISEIDGAGNTSVMVTLESGVESVYAINKKYNDSLPENEYVVIDTGSKKGGLLLKITAPKIRGVAIVCEGGDSIYVKEKITDTVTAVLDISSNRVSITKMR